MKLNNKKKYFISFTATFILIACFFYYFYFSQGRALFNLNGDGYRQNYRAIIYYQKYLKEIINNIFVNHSFVMPQWDFTLGEGSDIIETLNYYVVGDPFALFCVFVPYDYVYLYIDLMAFFRIYCAGLAFGCLCLYLGHKNWVSILIGSISYSFCFYGIMYTIEFPFMTNYMVFVPLIILGIEKIIKENKYLTLILSVFISATSSLPFFYIIVVLIVIYCLIRAIFIDITFKEKCLLTIKITVCSLLGVMLAAPVLLPSLFKLLSNTRTEKVYAINSLLSFNVNVIKTLTLGDHTLDASLGGITIPLLLTVITLLLDYKKCKKINLAILVFIILAIFSPFFSQLMRGFRQGTPCWTGVFCLPFSYIFVVYYDKFLEDGKNILFYLIPTLLLFIAEFYLDNDRLKLHILLLFAAIVAIIANRLFKNKTIKNILIYGVAVCCILLSIFNVLSPTLWDYTHKATNVSILNKDYDKEIEVAANIKDDGFYRYSGNSLVCNESSGGTIPSTNYYWSFPNDDVVNFRTDLGFYDYNLNHYDNYNERSELYDLASVKYYLAKDTKVVPYGFEYCYSENGYDVYKNKNALSLFYVYSDFIGYDDWKKMGILDRQETLLNKVVLNNSNNKISNANLTKQKVNNSYEINGNIAIDNNTININDSDSFIRVKIDFDGAGEYYIVLNNLEFNSATSTQIYFTNSNGVSNVLYHKTKDHFRYAGRNNYTVSLGYVDEPLEYVDISFLDAGEISLDSFEIYKLNVDSYEESINELNDLSINSLNIETNNISSNIYVDEDKFLCMSIPYTKGWKAYVDGKEVEIQKANVMYMGFNIEQGNHTIELKYSTPGFRIGVCLFSISLLTTVCYIVLRKNNKIKI